MFDGTGCSKDKCFVKEMEVYVVWTTLPQLVFNDKFCRGSVVRATTDKLMMTIYKVLLLHHGPLLKFTLSLADLESCPKIDQLIFFVSKNGSREFKLHVHSEG
ncbi:hypothetical protein RHMOL_Rhmol05G0136100 [Rhododendron molle]|uniref:Uncharacterized protein n=1 Tax=Rhododendron molle TaxID=49168 RepID=A0ACC0NQS3_RHOML|nr:hypothetical protein RHMOL_Rhmol05G0136100 [Rhododendron molle]